MEKGESADVGLLRGVGVGQGDGLAAAEVAPEGGDVVVEGAGSEVAMGTGGPFGPPRSTGSAFVSHQQVQRMPWERPGGRKEANER